MDQVESKKWRMLVALFALWICLAAQSLAQPISDSERIAELGKLRAELKSSTVWNADALVVLSERAIADAVQQFVGLEITLANGNVMKLTSIESRLVTGAALVKINVQSKSVNLQLSGRLSGGEIDGKKLKLPLRVTEVKLLNGLISSVLIKTLFGSWLKPETWNDELPSLDLPLELAETVELPASQFSIAPSGEGQIPMEISTAAYRAPLKLTLTSLLLLDKRAVLALRINSEEVVNTSVAESVLTNSDPIALENEIVQIGSGLTGEGDVRLRLSRNVISSLLSNIAAQQNPDLKFKLKQGRVRANEVKAVVSILNYTDIENGEGQADISELKIESISDGRVNVRLSGQGVIDARVKGREYGVPYGLSPRTNFAIQNQLVPLQFTTDSGRAILRALAGTTLPLNLRFSLNVAGRDVGINRTEVVQVDRWLNRIELPALLNREILLPRKLELDAGGNLYVTDKSKLDYTLSNLRVWAGNDALEITADVKVNPK